MLLRVLRPRRGALAGAFVILAVAATIAAAAGEIIAGCLRAPGAGRFATADVVVRADPTFWMGGANGDRITVERSALLPQTALTRVAAVPGVHSAVGDVAFPLTITGRGPEALPAVGPMPVYAHGWPSASVTPYRLTAGSPPRGPEQIVLDVGLARAGNLHVGSRVRVSAPTGIAAFRVSGVALAEARLQRRRSAAFFTQARAEQLSGLGAGYQAIVVRAPSAARNLRLRKRIAAAVGGHVTVLSHGHAAAADAGDPSAFDRAQLAAVLAAGGGITLAIALFVVAGTIAFAVQGRRRQVAVVRVVGATPGQVRRALAGGTALVGIGAGVTGCGVATLALKPFVDALVAVHLAPSGFAVAVSWIPYAIAIAAGAMVALGAALIAAHRVLTVAPGEAMIESAIAPRRLGVIRTLVGLTALGGGIALVLALRHEALSFAVLDGFCLMIAVASLSPVLIGWPVAAVGALLRGSGAVGYLTGTAMGGGRFRVGATSGAVALVVALAGTQVVGLATAKRALQHVSEQRVVAQRVIVSRDGGLPQTLTGAIARLPGVTATGLASTEVYLLDHQLTNQDASWPAVGLDGRSGQTLRLGVRAGSLRAVAGDGVAVSETLARTGGVGVGARLAARLADGTRATLRIVAVFQRADGFGDVLMGSAPAHAHATAAVDQAVFVAGVTKRDLSGVERIVRAVPGAILLTRAQYLRELALQNQQDADSQWVIGALMIVIAVLAAFNSGATAAAERRHELLLARLCGATRAQVRRSLALESLLTTLAGIAAGTVVVLVSLSQAGHDPTGGPLAVPGGQAALVIAGAAALGLGGTLIPASLSGRGRLASVVDNDEQ
jgi:putative ABC transport system permease protein